MSERQLNFDDLLGTRPRWELDVAQGELKIGEYALPAQILGSWSPSERSWTWAWTWALSGTTRNDRMLAAALSMRQLGQDSGIAELVTRKVTGPSLSGHTMAVVAAGVLNSDAYYICPIEGNDVCVLLSDVPGVDESPSPLVRVISGFPQAAQLYDIADERSALSSFCDYLGLATEPSDDTLLISDSTGHLVATFSSSQELLSITGSLKSGSRKKRRQRYLRRGRR